MQGECDMARKTLLLSHVHNGGTLDKDELLVTFCHDSTLLDVSCN